MSFRLHSEAWKFLAIFGVATAIFFMLNDTLGWMGCILTAWCAYFFRMPDRVTPSHKDWIVSPADGKIVLIQETIPPADFNMGNDPLWRVSVFLNVFDVHVNYMPLGGKITKVLYHPGQFVNASLDKASDLNERNSVVIETEDSKKIGVVQIAGLIARRIRCDVTEGQAVHKGDVFGLIRFGSRVDVYLPQGVSPLVEVGQRMIGGETLIAHIS